MPGYHSQDKSYMEHGLVFRNWLTQDEDNLKIWEDKNNSSQGGNVRLAAAIKIKKLLQNNF